MGLVPPKKARCPRCDAVARKLYHRLGAKVPFEAVEDAAECPDHGAFLLHDDHGRVKAQKAQ